jgi:histone H2A
MEGDDLAQLNARMIADEDRYNWINDMNNYRADRYDWTPRNDLQGPLPQNWRRKISKQRRRRIYSFSRYIDIVRHQVHPDFSISRRAVLVIDNLLQDLMQKIGSIAGELVRKEKKQTLTDRDIKAACSFFFPGQLAKHSIMGGSKSVDNILGVMDERDRVGIKMINGKPVKNKRSTMCGLSFPVGRIETYLRKGCYAKRVGSMSAPFMAAVLEYMCAEILELAGNDARNRRKRRITPRCIGLGIRNDQELHDLFQKDTIAWSGIVPGIHKSLLPRKNATEYY